MRKICIIALGAVLLVLLFPFRIKRFPIEGTLDISSLLCRIVVWNRDISSDGEVYHRTVLYFFPDTLKDLDELYFREMERPDAEKYIR